MEKLIGKKKITTIAFLCLLFLYAAANGRKEIPVLVQNIQEQESEMPLAARIAQVDAAVTENAAGRYYFIDAYGWLQRLMGKQEESNFEVVKDTEGKLHYTYFAEKPQDTSEIAGRMKRLADEIQTENTKLLFVLPPDKYIEGHTSFAKGLPYHMSNESADQFLEQLNGYGIGTLDLRDYLADSGIPLSEAFYTTDHHWKIETAFWAASQFCEWLNEDYGETLDPDGFYADAERYNFVTYPEISLGSMGRKTGRYYAGADDFTLIYPKFDTDYLYENTIEPDIQFGGRFEEALMATPVIRQSEKPFDADMYMTYLYGNPAFSHIENKKEPDSLDICIIKDSFAVPFSAFTSLRCHTVDMIDPRYFEGDYGETLRKGQYDYVVVMISPQDLVEEFFPFCAEE